MSLNSAQFFAIENCNWPTIENGLNNLCLHPLSRTFTFNSLNQTKKIKSSLYPRYWIHLRDLALDRHSSEATSPRWRTVGNTAYDLTGVGIQPLIPNLFFSATNGNMDYELCANALVSDCKISCTYCELLMKTQDLLCIVSSFVENIFFSGAVLGWPSLQYVLLRENYFGNLCKKNATENSNDTHESSHLTEDEIIFCPSRDATLNLALALAFAFQYFASYFSGIILDRYGTWVYRCIASISLFIAYTLLAVSNTETSWLVYVAVLFLSSGGLSIGISNIQTANLAGPFKGLVINLQSGTFTTAAVVFLIVREAHSQGVSLMAIFFFFAFLSLFTVARTFTIMPKRFIPLVMPKNGVKYGWKEWSCFKDPSTVNAKYTDTSDDNNTTPLRNDDFDETKEDDLFEGNQQPNRYENFRKSAKSLIFWMNIFTFCVGHLRQSFYIGSFVNWVETFEKDKLQESITVFNVTFLMGAIAAPLCGLLFDAFVKFYKKRLTNIWTINIRASFFIMFINSALLTAVSLLVIFHQTLSSIVGIVVSQCFVYGGNWTVVGVAFPMRHYGKLLGITQFFAGLASLVSYGLFRLALSYDPQFTYVNISLLILCLLTFLHPFVLYKKSF